MAYIDGVCADCDKEIIGTKDDLKTTLINKYEYPIDFRYCSNKACKNHAGEYVPYRAKNDDDDVTNLPAWGISYFDREQQFYKKTLRQIKMEYPDLKIIKEYDEACVYEAEKVGAMWVYLDLAEDHELFIELREKYDNDAYGSFHFRPKQEGD